MTTQIISLQSYASTKMMGMRCSALPVRGRIEEALALGVDIALDFSGVEATQAFVDELVGVLVVQRGADILRHIKFKGCSKDVQAIVQFVVTERNRRHHDLVAH